MHSIKERQDEIIADFNMFDNWMQKYEYLIDLGKELSPINEANKVESNLINGCQSKVWLYAENINKKIVFTADSDAVMTKGIISLLINILSNQNANDIATADLYFIQKIGLTEQLSATRANGLASMIKQMKIYALAFNN
tara:strand:+ start:750 stop:1166 length:417 start_codon:yes stop_codon:yes gene_type:complete